MQKVQSSSPATSATAASCGAPARTSALAADRLTGAMNNMHTIGMLCAIIVSVSIISRAIVHTDRTWSSESAEPCSQKVELHSIAE